MDIVAGNTANTVETDADFGAPPDADAKRIVTEITLYEKTTDKYRKRCEKIVKRYRDERPDKASKGKRMNVLWANIQTLAPTIYAQTPKADVQRRFKDQDPVGRVASTLLERSVDYFLDCDGRFDSVMRQVRDDYLLTGMGVAWQRYNPVLRTVTPDPIAVYPQPMMGMGPMEGGEAGEGVEGYLDAEGNFYPEAEDDANGGFMVSGEPYEELEYEEVIDDYVYYQDFGHNSGARTWDEVYLVWRRAYMTRDALVTRFGEEIGRAVPLDYTPSGIDKDDADKNPELYKKACVYEAWDKNAKKVYWVSKAHPQPLDTRDDPLKLSMFFPCPRPMYATMTNGTMIPVPDFAQYQDQAEEIDDLTNRIDHLTSALRVRGLYAGDLSEIKRLFNDSGDLDLIPVENWAMYAEKGGLANVIAWVPVRDIAETLVQIYGAREQAKQAMYEVTGLSDILRGASDAGETATAQAIKAQWGSVRVRDKQWEVQRFARDMVRIKAEIIAEHFQPETILQIANVASLGQDQALAQPALDMLKNEPLRHWRLDIETDSTVQPDEQAEKAARNEFLTAVGTFLSNMLPIAQAAPPLVPVIGEMLAFGIRGFKVGDKLENVIEQAFEQIAQQAMQPPAPPQPDPTEMIKLKAEETKAQASVAKAGVDLQKAQIEAQTLPLQVQQQYDRALQGVP